MSPRIVSSLAVAAALACANGPALGQGADSVTCTASNITLNFGSYDALSGTPLEGAGSFTVTCTQRRNRAVTVVYIAQLASAPARMMAPPAGPDRLSYQVYIDPARTQPWGDGTAGTFVIAGVVTIAGRSSATDTPRFFYARIAPGGQDVSAASPGPPPTTYQQTLTVTVRCLPSPPC